MNWRSRWRRRFELLGSVAVAVCGLNLLSFSSMRVLALSISLAILGIGWFVRTLVVSAKSEGKTWKSNVALIVVSTSLALFAILLPALLIRVGSSLPAGWQRFDAELGWVQDSADAVGQRDDHIDPTREHVLVVGDSILYGQGIANEETAPYLLNRMLPPYQVVNLSISGYSIDQYYLYLRRVLPRTRPRVVVIGIYSGNDFEITSRGYGWAHTKPLFVEEGGKLVRTNPDLLDDNCIDRVAQSLLFRFLWRNHDMAQVALDHLCGARQLELDEAERAIAAMFREMDAISAAAGARVLYVLLPEQRNFVGHTGGQDALEIHYSTMYRRLRRLLDDGKHPYFEFAGDVARSRVPFNELYLDPGHFRAVGHVLLADALKREILARGLLERPAAAAVDPPK